ncbi:MULTISPECIES: methionine ABC transporter permease [Clostridium]|uniref:D-methionine transport system permease protein n=3 Tax=Clostridium TaxID=1485 RepID=A0A0B5QPK2_CLOBE|nr:MULTISPECIES: methionine ABC transporter permease [Clostridium]AJG99952.1 methionine ABC transporter permease [Clostridium beijerinckii]ALB45813.1 ABC transporter permease [Clostridium beijerinckii NRRL B-598]AQS05750.1 D-methionine transport system permease protein MetI [Clostridium beijerinckii]MBA2885379.1 D-methionine transport system permease protein [Clostridium beijerinckii]MBA2900120.1 D-methionine transport system permease protein [Clostridium beijerinckii]
MTTITGPQIIKAIIETLQMVSVSLLIGSLLGIPLGILLVITNKGGIIKNKAVYSALNNVINIVRSVPFIILLAAIVPFTRLIVGTSIGTKAAIVPLIIYIIPYIARLIENSLLEVNDGIIEAAESMGATPVQIIWHFLLPEAMGSLILSLTTATIGLIGATAMAGTIGAGGIGDVAISYGYQRFDTKVILITVIILIIFVQAIQNFGNKLARKVRRH